MDDVDEWEAFIAEARAKGYGRDENASQRHGRENPDDKGDSGGDSSSGSSNDDEPIPIIPARLMNLSREGELKAEKVAPEPEDAEEAVRRAGIGMSNLSILLDNEPKKVKNTVAPIVNSIPPLTPTMFSKLSTPKDEIIFDELAAVMSIGRYTHKKYPFSLSFSNGNTALPRLPSSMFLSAGSAKLAEKASLSDNSSQLDGGDCLTVSLSFAHLFVLATFFPPLSRAGTPFIMQFVRSTTSLTFTTLDVPLFADRAAAHLSLYLPGLYEQLLDSSSCPCSTISLNQHRVSLEIHPVALHLPNSAFSESLTALTAAFAPNCCIMVGRLDPMTGSVHSVQPVTLDLSQSSSVRSFAYLLDRLSCLPAGEYTLLHRAGADNVVIGREREDVSEMPIPCPLLGEDIHLSLEQLNS